MDAQSAREETIRAYQLHAGVLLAYAHRLTRDDALAQDALQETFLRFFLALVQGEDIQNARAWLHRVAHNYVCDTLKSAAIRTAVPLEDAGEDRLRDERGMPGADRAADWIEAARQLLAPREWQCVQLRAEGFDYTEIATELAIRPGTVGSFVAPGCRETAHPDCERKRDRHETAWQMASKVMETQACGRSWQ